MVKNPHFHCRGHGFDPGRGTKIPHVTRCGQKKKGPYLLEIHTEVLVNEMT